MAWAIIAHAMSDWTYLPRVAAPLVRSALQTSPVVVLMGARQSGKTTLVQSEDFLADRTYLTLDDFDTLDHARDSATDLVQCAPRLTLDEIQREPSVLLAIKRLVDGDRPRRCGRFLLTGSANLLLMRRVSETLAGRVTYVQLGPLTRRERLGLGESGIWTSLLDASVERWPDVVGSESLGPADWRVEVEKGGYPTPAIELEGAAARSLWFDGYVQTYLERDLQGLASIRDLGRFRKLMRMTCLRLGTISNQAALGRAVGIPRPTVQRYLDLLETCYQLVRLRPYTASLTKRLVKSPKLYWTDPGMALWLGGAKAAGGAHLENLVLSDLLAWRDSQPRHPDVLFWRTSTDLEVDFVIEAGERLLAVEVKASSNPGYRATRGLRAFREEYSRRGQFAGGLLLHCGAETRWLSDRILAVPWWKVI